MKWLSSAIRWTCRTLLPRRPVDWLMALTVVGIFAVVGSSLVRTYGTKTTEVRVRVYVYDATTDKPIDQASVVFESRIVAREPDDLRRWTGYDRLIRYGHTRWSRRTQPDGTAMVRRDVRVVPDERIFGRSVETNGTRLFVSKRGYGGFIVPLSPEPIPVETLKARGTLFVPVGLYPVAPPGD